MSNHRTTLAGWAVLWILACGAAEAGDSFATIDGEPVSFEEFDRFVYNESRQTYYHGSPLDDQGMIDFRRSAADKWREWWRENRDTFDFQMLKDQRAAEEAERAEREARAEEKRKRREEKRKKRERQE